MTTIRPHPSLDRILSDSPPAFAVVYRPTVSGAGVAEILCGTTSTHDRLADVWSGADSLGEHPAETLLVVPFRQVAERGFSVVDDGTDLVAMHVDSHTSIEVAELVAQLPDVEVSVADAGFETDDATYVEEVHEIINEEIGRGEGSNFVVKRTYTGQLVDYDLHAAFTVFRRLLLQENGAYWTFLVNIGDRVLVGASPERHVSCEDGVATMNPISGTFRYPESGPILDGLIEFLGDRKETDELNMVVDEELKMMARVCDQGVWLTGPMLKEMSHLAHTEYHINGHTTRSPIDLLRATLFAPTVVGSPLENAFRVIARREAAGRGYYSGVVGILGRDESGRDTLDSAILIRTAEIDEKGQLEIGVGATLVRHSEAASEVAETRSKAAGLLSVLDEGAAAPQPHPPSTGSRQLQAIPKVAAGLTARNARLAKFWFRPAACQRPEPPMVAGNEVLILDAEDAFSYMLAHQLGALGLDVTVRDVHDEPVDLDGPSSERRLIVLGPGPGDPRDAADPKIARMRDLAGRVRTAGVPLLAVCLGHQALCAHLGLELIRLQNPNQGAQREIDLFGTPQLVGFYNTFVATSPTDRMHTGGIEVEVSRDPTTGHVHALRAPGVQSLQFHPESILTRTGIDVLADCVRGLVPDPRRQQPVTT